ncbi:MAG TPA: NADH:flavin oxidoreductase/NADH oxidase [Beijerinckiaceae bacterium]|jgi:2,4-dienoyl-CoA reductase-like NADH-dependent reductase (Old Yellow Enzyme family)
MTAPLFSPFGLGPVRLSNRIVVSPMCQYSANDGCMNDWHLQHLMTMAMSGAALVVVEATAVERLGRITHGCTGLYSDDNERAMARAVAAARGVALPGVKFGVQIGHAGRKASAQRPWEGGKALKSGDDPWTTFAPSPIPFDDGWPVPEELTDADLDLIERAFVEAAERAVRVGFEVVELHMAHGYLLHTFQSPLSNKRTDRWGGTPERRAAYPFRIARAVRAAVPAHVALGARITGSDWTEDGLRPEDAVAFAKALKEIGLDFVCVSSGGIALKARIPVGPGYQVPFAAKVRREAGIATRAVGMIVDPSYANDVVTRGDADMVALARALLDDPRWGWHAAEALGADLPRPPQYARAAPGVWPGAALVRPREDDEFRRSA